MEEYITDCLLMLDHRVVQQIGTRRLRVVKYRGTAHGTDEYPFAITSKGMKVYPVTSATLDYPASTEHLSSGVADLDTMLAGKGYLKGSSILVAGEAGTGKTTLAAHLAASVARSGQRCAYFAFEESPDQLCRNMASVGLNLEAASQTRHLTLMATRPSLRGLEQHLAVLQETSLSNEADVVVIDPITNLISVGSSLEVKAMLMRLLDGFKQRQTTVLLTSLIFAGDISFGADIGISSLMDTILHLEHHVVDRRRQRLLSILKSRGTAHSREIRELFISDSGVRLLEPDTSLGQGEG